MKFLCDQCKAKYQISDDKVAGKTVRMTCRKCGHNIEVRAEITETSVADAKPPAPPGAPPPGSPAGPPRAPQKPAPPRAGGLATQLSAAPRSTQKPGALAGAFQSSVKKDTESALDLLSMSTSAGWYVAINGVPVGPVRASELRRKAAQGSVTEESLVWQEGMDEWRPVRAVAELAALVREAATSGRPSLISPAPGEARSSAPPPPSAGASQAIGSTTGRASRPSGIPPRPAVRPSEQPAAAVARSNVVPFTGGAARLATAEKLDLDDDAQLTEVQMVPSSVAPAPPAPARPAPAPPPPMASPDPFAVPPAASPFATPAVATPAPSFTPGFGAPAYGSPALSAPATASAPFDLTRAPSPSMAPLAPEPQSQRKAPPWIPIAMIGAGITFGLVGGVAYFFNKPAAPPQVVIQMPSATAAAPAPPPSATAADPAPAPTDSITVEPAKPGTPPRAGGGKAGAAAPGKPVDPSIAALLQGSGSGPSAGPGGGGGGGGGSSLSSDAIESVVRSHSAGVKRTCWERGGSQQSSVNVTCRVVIGGGGQVSSASANGSDPVVSKCIENSVRGWTFPPSGGTTTVDIPFHFVRQ